MNAERTFSSIADWRPFGDLPLGKALLYLGLTGIPGKLTTKIVRALIGKITKGAPIAGMDVYKFSNIVGPLVGILEAWGWKGLRKSLGETLSEALAVGTIAGSLDAGFERGGISRMDKDLTDHMSDFVRGKIFKAAGVGALPGITPISEIPLETAGSGLGAFPEAASSAFTGEERYAGPSLASPEDPVNAIEEKLKEISKT